MNDERPCTFTNLNITSKLSGRDNENLKTERIVQMSSITNKQLKGNFAENLVAEWISRVCLVRPVAVGTDIGIDLYCESIVKNNPYLHFWVQVKAIGKKDIKNRNGVEFASYKFKRSHLEYWARQPIPVYAFLVPVIDWPPKYPDRIYAVRITKHVIENGLPIKDTIKLETSECTEFASIDKDWNQFIAEVVPVDSAILLLSKGLVTNVEFLGSKQTHYAKGFVLKYADEILNKARDAIIMLGSEALERQNDDYKGIRHLCEDLASFFIRNMHELGVNFLVKSALRDGNSQRALQYVDKIQREVESRKDIDEATKLEYTSKLVILRRKITG